MKRTKMSWLGTGLLFVLVANFAVAQRSDDDTKGRGRDRGDRGQNSRQADQYPQTRRQSPNPYQNRQRDDISRGQPKDYQPAEKDSRERQPRTPDSDSQYNERKGSLNNRQDELRKNDNSTRQKDLDIRQKDAPSRDRDINPRDNSRKQNQPREATKEPVRNVPTPKLTTKEVRGGSEKVTASGQVREKTLKKSDGEHTQYMGATGRVQREVVRKTDGSEQATHYGTNGKVERTVVTKRDGSREVANVRYDRSGKERATETVRVDTRGREVSKTVVVKNKTVIVNKTVIRNTTIVRNYDRARFGFVYRPVYVVHAPVFVSWYDPYWYTPHGVLIVHPFHFYWGWDRYDWYSWHRHYWVTYDVYPAPCYWLTDWMIADYVADRYADAVSAEQARDEARAAREDAERARDAAERAREDAEIAEANAARAEAEARAAKAEARAARLEREESSIKSRGGQPNPNATPIDPQTKEDLRKQVEQEIADKKAYADASASGKNPPPPDLTKALADPKHIYPVSSQISVTSATDQSPAGVLTEGDLLRVEPGQESILKDADENTLITMRVMTSKGDDGEVKAGTLVSISLKSLQEFDSEFKAKLDLGLAEADKNKDEFRGGAVKSPSGS